MKRSHPDDERPSRSPEEMLDWIYERGQALRTRRRIVQAFSASVTMTLIVVATVIAFDSEPRGILIISPTSSESPFVEEDPTPTPTPSEASTDEPSSPSPTPESSSALVCRNSYDERCGELVWVPDPGPNAPLTLRIYISPANPQVGDEVHVRVVATDPDAPISPADIDIHFPSERILVGDCFAFGRAYGRWDTPPREAGSAERVEGHTFDAAGTFTIRVEVRSFGPMLTGEPCRAHSPYASSVGEQRTVVVTGSEDPPSSPTPTPSPSSTET